MKMTRSAWIGGGVLVFSGLVFAMVPPTKPLGGAKIDPVAHHGLADLPAPRAMAAQPVALPSKPASPISSGYSGQAATVASAAGSPWPWRPADEEITAPASQFAPAAPRPSPRAYSPPQPRADARYAYDPEPASPEEDRAFRAGYRWAQARRLNEPRACGGLDGGPGSDGCAAYASAARNRVARYDRDDDRYQRYERGDIYPGGGRDGGYDDGAPYDR
jgi:hypothetical protein